MSSCQKALVIASGIILLSRNIRLSDCFALQNPLLYQVPNH